MKVAIVGNASSMGTYMMVEMRRRGMISNLFSPYMEILHNTGWRLNARGLGFYDRFKRRARFEAHRRLNKYDFQITLGGYPSPGLSCLNHLDYWMGVEVFERKIEQPGYFATLDLLPALPKGSMFLPRCVGIKEFCSFNIEKVPKKKSNIIRIGHFWHRGDIVWDYATRWFKQTDLLLQAFPILEKKGYRPVLVDQLVPHENMPVAYQSLDVLAEQFRVGSYGIPAIESLLVKTPVVGYYTRELCECPEIFDELICVDRNPESIALGIIRSLDHRVGSTRGIEAYHSARHTVDILEDTWKKFKS